MSSATLDQTFNNDGIIIDADVPALPPGCSDNRRRKSLMIGLLQRVSEAKVRVGGETLAQIGPGLLVLVGIEKTDEESHAERLLERLLSYRVFEDEQGRMNRSLRDTGGGLLLVPQFTLVADTRRGSRPGFSDGAPSEQAARLFTFLAQRAAATRPKVQQGRFGAEMAVSLTNQGPVTFWLKS